VGKKADLVKWRQSLAMLQTKGKAACAGGAADALKRLDLKELGMAPSPNFERSMPQMCAELAR
jgi:DNA-binding SARP family transcriptional activator